MNRDTHYNLEDFLKKRVGKRRPERKSGLPKSHYFPTLKNDKQVVHSRPTPTQN